MSIDAPTTPDAGIGTLPDPRIEDRVAPQPAAHGAAVQAVFNDAGRDLALYSAVHQLWYDLVGDSDEEPGIAAELDHHELTCLDAPTPGREWVVKLTSSRWKAGTGTGDDYSAYYKYDLTLRERDEDGDLYKTGKACSLRVIPQFGDLNYKDGEPLTLQYDEGSLVRCSTTWADTAAEVEGRMLDTYGEDTITEILSRRAREGLGPSAVDKDVLQRIARLSEGDARQAIAGLRVAARMASREGLSAIPGRLVEDAVSDAEHEVRQKTISKLNTHQRALYEVLAEEDGLIQKELYARYQEAHDDPVTLRYLRENHLPKLEHYNLVDVEQDRGSKRYHLVGVDHTTPTPQS